MQRHTFAQGYTAKHRCGLLVSFRFQVFIGNYVSCISDLLKDKKRLTLFSCVFKEAW